MIRFSRVSRRFGAAHALEDIDWEVEAGERVVVLGHSGAGKTTLLRLITMELLPSQGSVQVGSYVSGRISRSARALLRRSLGIVFEDLRLLPDRNVFDNLALVLNVAGTWDRALVERKVKEALERVGALDRAYVFPHELSAGERQRAAVARALVREPLLVVADEPTGKLESQSAERVLGALYDANQAGATVVLATNDETLASRFGGRVTRLVEGRIPVA